MNIAAILPCRGRHEQTVVNVRRLRETAGFDRWSLICVGGTDERVLLDSLEPFGVVVVRGDAPRLSYWQALNLGTAEAIEHQRATHIVSLANDLIPVGPWLARAAHGYQQQFGDSPALVGFNGDGHPLTHSCHMLIDVRLLERYGGWPAWYDHTYGDTELCARAQQDGCYAKAPWAILAHDHPYFGGVDDAVYAEGRAQLARDEALYHERRRLGWPRISHAATTTESGRAISVARG